jgi:hypothetical protein
MAVIFNCIDSDLKAVQFCEVTGYKTCIRVLFFCTCERVLFFRHFSLLLCIFSIFTNNLFWNNINMDFTGLSNEKALN